MPVVGYEPYIEQMLGRPLKQTGLYKCLAGIELDESQSLGCGAPSLGLCLVGIGLGRGQSLLGCCAPRLGLRLAGIDLGRS